MVLRLRQHNIGYTADGFYRSDDPTNSVKGEGKGERGREGEGREGIPPGKILATGLITKFQS